jgi:hypothetical protein
MKIIIDGGFLGDGKKKEAATNASRRAAQGRNHAGFSSNPGSACIVAYGI